MEAILAFETSMNHLCNFVIILVEQKCAPLFQGEILISDHSPKSICLSENYLILAKNWKRFVFFTGLYSYSLHSERYVRLQKQNYPFIQNKSGVSKPSALHLPTEK
jgi:hypothetical protein